MMHKILFTEFAELRQGDGLGPQYFPGKAYWLTLDQAVRWKAEGVAEDAPEDMKAENESAPTPLRPDNVRIIKRKNQYHVIGPDDHPAFHDEPLTAHGAEKLRQRILAGEHVVKAVEPEIAPEPEPEPEPETVKSEPDEVTETVDLIEPEEPTKPSFWR
jgi:hypothetical protein